ncbi:MAG: ABC transporter ATP-binding protein [Halodesulfurarchaeum sp.]
MRELELADVHTYYGESHILEGVDLHVETGEVVALIGRNGVGKTTTLRSVLQLTPPRSGEIRVKGENVVGERPHYVANLGVGWIPEERRIFSQLTVAENIAIASPSSIPKEQALERAFEAFPDLEEKRNQDAGSLSGGQQQMLAIARGIVGKNDLLLVDEPSEGLAPFIIEQVAESLSAVAADTTILLVEQNLPLALDLADRYYVLDNGRVVESGETGSVSPDDEEIRRHLTA